MAHAAESQQLPNALTLCLKMRTQNGKIEENKMEHDDSAGDLHVFFVVKCFS